MWESRSDFQIGRLAGWSGRIVALPRERMQTHLLTPHNLEQHLTMDSTRIRRELGYAGVAPLDEALRRTIEWERANPPRHLDPAAYDYAAEEAAAA